MAATEVTTTSAARVTVAVAAAGVVVVEAVVAEAGAVVEADDKSTRLTSKISLSKTAILLFPTVVPTFYAIAAIILSKSVVLPKTRYLRNIGSRLYFLRVWNPIPDVKNLGQIAY